MNAWIGLPPIAGTRIARLVLLNRRCIPRESDAPPSYDHQATGETTQNQEIKLASRGGFGQTGTRAI